MIKLLLVEDDLDLAGNIIDYLELEDMLCDHASNGVAALTLMAQGNYQAIVLDINLPKLDGLQVCARAREHGNDTPIIMLTARDQLSDKVVGFDHGADDYLVKPFAMEELVARLKALAKRRSGQHTQLTVGPLQLDVSHKTAKFGAENLKCSPTALAILEQLMRAYPNPVNRQTLIASVWGEESPDSNSLKVHMHNLRKSLLVCNEQVSINFMANSGFQLDVRKES